MTLLEFPEVVESAARNRAPHRIAEYLESLANQLNSWYHAGTRDPELRILNVPEPLMKARLILARASEVVVHNGLGLLGIAAPERM
jgi:arginyl-tRNA synthetase